MKYLALFFLFTSQAFATRAVELSWDANLNDEFIVAYRVYASFKRGQFKIDAENCLTTVPVPITKVIIKGVSDTQPTYFVVTAVDQFGRESEPSEELKLK